MVTCSLGGEVEWFLHVERSGRQWMMSEGLSIGHMAGQSSIPLAHIAYVHWVLSWANQQG